MDRQEVLQREVPTHWLRPESGQITKLLPTPQNAGPDHTPIFVSMSEEHGLAIGMALVNTPARRRRRDKLLLPVYVDSHETLLDLIMEAICHGRVLCNVSLATGLTVMHCHSRNKVFGEACISERADDDGEHIYTHARKALVILHVESSQPRIVKVLAFAPSRV